MIEFKNYDNLIESLTKAKDELSPNELASILVRIYEGRDLEKLIDSLQKKSETKFMLMNE